MRDGQLLRRYVTRTPNGIRTRAAAVKGRCPRPLDDGGSTATADVPMAPAVGDRFSIGDGRHWPQSSCRHRYNSARPAMLPCHACCAPCLRRISLACLALAVLVDEGLGDPGLLTFLRDRKPRDRVCEHSRT